MKLIYEKETGLRLELWGASTKHPDSVFYYNDYSAKVDYLPDGCQVYQWLLECASRLTWPPHAKRLAMESTYVFGTCWDIVPDDLSKVPEWYEANKD